VTPGDFAWIDPVLIPGSTPINAIHLAELRTALNDAYRARGHRPYTPIPSQWRRWTIKAIHLNQLRAGVRAFQ